MQILKVALRQASVTKQNVDTLLSRYLLMYCNTPHCTTAESPALLLMGRRLRTKLDLVFPSINKTVASRQEAVMKQSAHRGARVMQTGDNVQYRCYQSGESPWKFGQVSQVLGARYFMVKDGNSEIKRHLDQLVKIPEKSKEPDKQVDNSSQSMDIEVPSSEEERAPKIEVVSDEGVYEDTQIQETPSNEHVKPRYPIRSTRGVCPVRYGNFKVD